MPHIIYPLGFNDFAQARIKKDNVYKLVFDLSNDSQSVRLNLPIELPRKLTLFALVEDGWLPLPYVSPRQFFFDRNVIGYIERIKNGDTGDLYENSKYWLQTNNQDETLISPLLYAFESNLQRVPDRDEFRASFEQGAKILEGFYSSDQIAGLDEELFEAAYRLAEDVLVFHDQEMEYLKKAYDLIVHPVAKARLRYVAEELFSLADQTGIRYRSLPFYATLSCLYENEKITKFNAGREILKLKKGKYTDQKAYNALSDMRGLMFYYTFRAMAKSQNQLPYAFCTADKGLLMFGCGLNIKNDEFRGNQLFMTMDMHPNLFPNMDKEDMLEIGQRIGNVEIISNE